jgi:hypothetical protein
MLAASSRDALRRSLVGIAVEIQGTDESEVAYESGAEFFFVLLCFSHVQLPHFLRFFSSSLSQSWRKQSAETDRCLLPSGHSTLVRQPPLLSIHLQEWSIKFYRSVVGNKALSHY